MNQNDIYAIYVEQVLESGADLGRRTTFNRNLREKEARRITTLLRSKAGFSFLRLGDKELALMLAQQDGILPDEFIDHDTVDGTNITGGPGLQVSQVARLRAAYERADYIDFHEALPIVRELLPRLQLSRPSELERNPCEDTSYILPQWVLTQFKEWCECPGERVGIAASEAACLEHLSRTVVFKERASGIWPETQKIVFHQIRNNGRNLARNIDLVKEDLRAFIVENNLTCVFLSLGGAAKSLCTELSTEMDTRMVDFGAMTRSLCDMGSGLHITGRTTHSIKFFDLPYDCVMDAIEASQPDITASELLSKAYAQLFHLLSKGERGISVPSCQPTLNSQTIERFRDGYRVFKMRYQHLTREDKKCRQATNSFLHFCGKHGLTTRGRSFLLYFRCKQGCKYMLEFSRLVPRKRSQGCIDM